MDKLPFLKLALLIEKQNDNIAFTDEDWTSIFDHLSDPEPKAVSLASSLIAGDKTGEKLKLLQSRFLALPRHAQRITLPFFAASTHHEIFIFLFDCLKEGPPHILPDLMVYLSKTKTFILPYILTHLPTADGEFLERLKRLLFNLGFNNLRPYLKVMPQLPREDVFKDVFGEKLILSLKPGYLNTSSSPKKPDSGGRAK